MPRRRRRRSRRCIVIGGGLAGLAAAHALARKRWKVTVLEALPRLGGRVFSFRFEEAPELVCELGGEWIGSDHHRMKRLCRQFRLPLVRHQYSYSFWNGESRSKVYSPTAEPFTDRAQAGFEKFRKDFERHRHDRAKMEELDDRDWWSELERMGYSPADQLQRDLMDSTDFGESIRLTSAYIAAAEYAHSNDTDEVDWKIRSGNSCLVEKLAKAIARRKGRVRANERVVRILQGPDFVEVHTRKTHTRRRGRPARETKGRYRADFCICTTPSHALNKIRWTPRLPREQRQAASQLQYSRIMKTAVLYANRFWKDQKRFGFALFTDRAADFCFHSTFKQPGPMGILCSYSIGDKADDLAAEPNENELMRWITEDAAAAVRPKADVPIAPIRIRTQKWQREKWIGGAYAFYRPGQWFHVRDVLARSFDRVYFGGEHLSEEWQGFMEGAVETGEAAAKKVLARVRLS